MTIPLGKLLKPVFKVSPLAFQTMAGERYGYGGDLDETWPKFEPVARTLIESFYQTLDDPRFDNLVRRLEGVDIDLRGIGYEGAGMGLMLLDALLPFRRRLPAFLEGPGERYGDLVCIGAGLVLPRAPGDLRRYMGRVDPLLRWFLMDGFGFYEGFFSWRTSIDKHQVPSRVTGYGRRAYDQGLGRALWFITGATPGRIIPAIASFPAERQGDIWSGIGVACAYAAGVVDGETIQALAEAAGENRTQVAVGAALAAGFRHHAGSTAVHTELACDVLWGLPTYEVARIAFEERKRLPRDGWDPAYEVWRQRLARRFAGAWQASAAARLEPAVEAL